LHVVETPKLTVDVVRLRERSKLPLVDPAVGVKCARDERRIRSAGPETCQKRSDVPLHWAAANVLEVIPDEPL